MPGLYASKVLPQLPHEVVLQDVLIALQEEERPDHGHALVQRLHPQHDQGACVDCHLAPSTSHKLCCQMPSGLMH